MNGDRRHAPPDVPAALDYPRPLRRRDEWWSLDGPWDFAIDRFGEWEHPDAVEFDREITVPFAPESPASGIGDGGYVPRCWYRRVVDLPPARRSAERLILNFGAVDHRA